jgi:hypothetical protein
MNFRFLEGARTEFKHVGDRGGDAQSSPPRLLEETASTPLMTHQDKSLRK